KSVEAIPHHDDLREVFLNPPDIGGRYSALTYVGLVPASLIGIDLDPLLESAGAMLAACRDPDPATNPGVSLGLAMGTLAKNGRDKLTFVADRAIASFGAWVEQLIAESTGKHGTGLGPFDQPSVEEAKELTRKVLGTASSAERPEPPPAPLVADDATGLTLHGDAALRLTAGDGTVVGELARHLARRKPNAYLALQAFIAPSWEATAALDRIRALLRDATRCATTAGYGPRFLHSTGQLHKGGTPIGWFLQLTADHPVDRPI